MFNYENFVWKWNMKLLFNFWWLGMSLRCVFYEREIGKILMDFKFYVVKIFCIWWIMIEWDFWKFWNIKEDGYV